MACNLIYDDSVPMSPVQMFNYIRHRYADLPAYYLADRDMVAMPLTDDTEEVAASLRELAIRKGLNCSRVSAVWPELVGAEMFDHGDIDEFLVISAIRGKYLQPG